MEAVEDVTVSLARPEPFYQVKRTRLSRPYSAIVAKRGISCGCEHLHGIREVAGESVTGILLTVSISHRILPTAVRGRGFESKMKLSDVCDVA
jgi:hypothetical protein